MSTYKLSPQMREVISRMSGRGGVPQELFPFHTLKALERRELARSEMTRHGAYWWLTRGGRVVSELLQESEVEG